MNMIDNMKKFLELAAGDGELVERLNMAWTRMP